MPLWVKVVICVGAVELLGAASGLLGGAGADRGWYESLRDPPGTPPGWVFGPVWTVLYAMMGTALALAWHRDAPGPAKSSALCWWGAQFVLNLLWTPVFFGAHHIFAALVVIVALLAAIIVTLRLLLPVDRRAAWLLVPYACWVAYATYLNAGYLVLNR